MGWYKNNMKNGNFITINSETLEMKESGWYMNNIRTTPFRSHEGRILRSYSGDFYDNGSKFNI